MSEAALNCKATHLDTPSMAILTLGNGTIQTTPEREAYNALRLKYQNLAEKAQQDFSDRFSAHFSNMDQLHLNCTKVAQQYLDGPIDQAIRNLVSIGIMDIDDERFRNKFLAPYRTWEHDFAEVDDKYLAIILKAEELAKYKAARREDRGGGIVGGGFGLEGAAAGMAVATAANVAIGVVGGVFNLGADALSAMGDGMQKWSLYNDSNTKNHLAESIYRLVFQVHLAIVDAAAQHQKNVYEKISDEDRLKAKSLFVNLSKGRIAGDIAESYLIESISLNPFEQSSYFLWLDLYGDVDGHLSNVAVHFGIREVSDRKRQMLLQHKETLKVSTAEECEASLIDLENYAKNIAYPDIDAERASLLSMIDSLKLKQRTFNGEVYETPEMAQDLKSLQDRTVDEVIYNTSYEAYEIRSKKKKVSFFLGLSIFIAPLPNALLTLQSGYSKNSRWFANIWLVLFLMLIFFSSKENDVGLLQGISAFTLFGLFVIPIRMALDFLLGKFKTVVIKDPSFHSVVTNSASVKAKEAKKVQLWVIVVVVLVLTGLIMPGKKAVEPVAVKSTEIVTPTSEANVVKAGEETSKAELVNQAKAAVQEAEDAKIALELALGRKL